MIEALGDRGDEILHLQVLVQIDEVAATRMGKDRPGMVQSVRSREGLRRIRLGPRFESRLARRAPARAPPVGECGV